MREMQFRFLQTWGLANKVGERGFRSGAKTIFPFLYHKK